MPGITTATESFLENAERFAERRFRHRLELGLLIDNAVDRRPYSDEVRCRSSWRKFHYARLRRSIRRKIMGVKINCIARPIFPPGATIVLGRVIIEPCSIDSR